MSERGGSIDPTRTPQWRSYLMPGTDVLRTIAELTDPTAVAIFERIVSADAETALRQDTDRPKTFDLAHLNDIHERLFADVYPFAGALRYVDTAKPGQTGEPFLHNRWIDTYTSAITQQLRLEDNLATRTDPGQWADRAAYYWAAMLHAHPYREGNGRSIRVWIEDLAHHAGHELDWTRTSAERNVHVAVAAANGDYEPMRALLTVAAGGTVGVDREVAALDDLDKLQHGQAWARTGAVFGTDEQKQTIAVQLEELDDRIGIVHLHLEIHDQRATSTEQPAVDRWRGLAKSINPAMTQSANWPQYANALDTAAADGIDVATELPSMLAARGAEPAAGNPDPGRPTATPPTARPARTETPESATPAPTRAQEMAAAAGYSPPKLPAPGRGR
jgi:cell filamentation protein